MSTLAEKVAQAERLAYQENTPLVYQEAYSYNFERLGIHNRVVWTYMVVALLFIGKGCMPFVNDAVHVVQAALIDDVDLGMSVMLLGGLVSAQDFTGGISKIVVAMTIKDVGPRRAWLVTLFIGAVNMLLIATTRQTWVIFACTVVQAFVHSFIYPSTTMVIAGWVDGQALGRAIGCVAVATKISPIAMSTLYTQLLLHSWRDCFFFASALFAAMFLIFVVFMRSSAAAIGFRDPTPPGARNDQKPRAPPLSNEPSSLRAMSIVFSMRRTWALLVAFCLLVLLKSSAKFATIYAKTRLGLSPSDATSLFTTYAIASACSGIFGGVMYDLVPGGKVGIGILMTSLNVLNCCGFIYALTIEYTGMVTMAGLKIFMAIVGFAGVLPVSLPFQIYAMAIGGVAHCGMLVATFEGFAMCVEALFDLLIGSLLEEQRFTTWLTINCTLAILGATFMAIFYLLDYRKAPRAPVLTAVPSMNFLTRNNSNLQEWMESFAAGASPPLTPPRSPALEGGRKSPGFGMGDATLPPAMRVDSKGNLQAIGEEEAEHEFNAAIDASARAEERDSRMRPSALNDSELAMERAASDDHLALSVEPPQYSPPTTLPPSAPDSGRSSYGSADNLSSSPPEREGSFERSSSGAKPPPKSIMRRSSSFV